MPMVYNWLNYYEKNLLANCNDWNVHRRKCTNV